MDIFLIDFHFLINKIGSNFDGVLKAFYIKEYYYLIFKFVYIHDFNI